MAIKLAIGADHRGYAYKTYIQQQMSSDDIVWHDVGAHDAASSDYPLFAHQAVDMIQRGVCDGAVLLCGTGIGMAIAANRVRGIYAGVAWCTEVARRGRAEDHLNILVIPADFVTADGAVEIVCAWYKSSPSNEERYNRRLRMVDTGV